jgi:hypothetical protein
MCDPVSGTMAAMAMIQQQQSQEAAKKQADAVNESFKENNEMQIDAYNKDMEAYWDEEVSIQAQAFENAEDAADAKLQMKVSQQQDSASMMVANAETSGGGATPQALLGNLRRSQLNSAMDLDDTYQRGVVALGGELSSLQRDKTVRRNQAIGAINSAPRAGYQTNESKLMAIGLAGGSAFVQGQAMQGNSLFPSTSPTKVRGKGWSGSRGGGNRFSKIKGAKNFGRKMSNSSLLSSNELGGMAAPMGGGRGVIGKRWTYRGTGANTGMRSRGQTWSQKGGFSYNYYNPNA